MKHEEITKVIIGCAMKIHSYFGPGFPEIIYQRALLIELNNIGIHCGAEVERDVYYEEFWVGKRRLDILVENKILIELKAILKVEEDCYSRVINYLKVFKLEVGLLLNFGKTSLEYKRFVN